MSAVPLMLEMRKTSKHLFQGLGLSVVTKNEPDYMTGVWL